MLLMKSAVEVKQNEAKQSQVTVIEISTYPYFAKFAQNFIMDRLKISSALV